MGWLQFQQHYVKISSAFLEALKLEDLQAVELPRCDIHCQQDTSVNEQNVQDSLSADNLYDDWRDEDKPDSDMEKFGQSQFGDDEDNDDVDEFVFKGRCAL